MTSNNEDVYVIPMVRVFKLPNTYIRNFFSMFIDDATQIFTHSNTHTHNHTRMHIRTHVHTHTHTHTVGRCDLARQVLHSDAVASDERDVGSDSE